MAGQEEAVSHTPGGVRASVGVDVLEELVEVVLHDTVHDGVLGTRRDVAWRQRAGDGGHDPAASNVGADRFVRRIGQAESRRGGGLPPAGAG
jgi:hypothetical protein